LNLVVKLLVLAFLTYYRQMKTGNGHTLVKASAHINKCKQTVNNNRSFMQIK